MRIAYCTICAANYLPFALTLHESLRSAGEQAPFTVFLADEVAGRFDPALLPFPLVETQRLPIPAHFDMAARYSVMEMSTAVKPFCIAWLFATTDADAVVYLDPDILLLRPLSHVHAALAEGAPLVLTPHATAPLEDGAEPDDLTFLRTGAYNLGFCAFGRRPGVAEFLSWWGRQLETRCVVDLPAGLFVDQKFLDLAPAMLPGAHILHHPGYNVAYWNLAHRPVTRGPEGWLAGGKPLHFFHFSGVVPGDPTVFSRHQNRFTVGDIGPLADLLRDYLAALDRHALLGGVRLPALPYIYGHLLDGTPFTEDMRWVHAALRPRGGRAGREACFSPDLNRFCALAAEVPEDLAAPITRLMHAIWSRRPDLQRAFRLDRAEGRRDFHNWFRSRAALEHRLPATLLAAHEALLAPEAIPGPADRPPGLDIHGYFRTESGIGAAARRLWRSARAAGIAAEAYALEGQGFEDRVEEGIPIATAPPRHDCALIHINADQAVRLFCHIAPDRLYGRYRIGAWYWELSRLPPAWDAAFDHLDEIWAATAFTARAFSRRQRRPVHVIPPCVPRPPVPEGDRGALRRMLGLPESAFIVLAGFDIGSFLARKNPLGAIRAFQAAFSGREALLVLKCHGDPARDPHWRVLAEAIARDPRILLLHRVMSPSEVAALQAACDVLLSLHRSEGFGLWIAECMALGKPVVATAYSGNMDFMDGANSRPVPFRLVPVGAGEYPMAEGQVWAEPDIEAAAAALAELAHDPALAARLGEAAQRRIAQAYSAEAVGARIAQRLAAIRAGWQIGAA
ncbi:MAG: glycosyltransferase [Rhodovarius sp.]|nr:glycosyltransferase [Rhodovarius sp.]